MMTNRLYGDLAWLWPYVSEPKDYAAEAVHWRQAIFDVLGPGRHHLLEMGVGGGHNLSHLTNTFDATAVDSSEAMLAHSRALNPSVEHLVGDMRSLRLNRTFDAVIIHDAIAYMTTEDDLRAVFATAAAHLRPGGVFLTAPDRFWETFHPPELDHATRSDAARSVTFIEYLHDPDPEDTAIEHIFFYMIHEGKDLRIEQDRHITGLFPLETWKDLLEEAGFRVETRPYPVYPDGRDAYLLAGVLESTAL